ncbi:MAG: type I glyceraldehyde-3-phosphate dehydrogenase [Magnetococcales bacterium]|nr:type I glyceraldehyde-3-phosphate dehydrogenase [Magnetococcales bacterium]
MTIRIGVNGFGRIGRSLFRAARRDPRFHDLRIVAVNDAAPAESLIHLLKYDSVMGRLDEPVQPTPQGFTLAGEETRLFSSPTPETIPWRDAGVDLVVEATGRFTRKEKAEGHLQAGAPRVVISAPGKGAMKTFVMGVNEGLYDPTQDRVVSNASCTTNALAVTAQVIHGHFGIESGLITTVHAYTNDQRLLDAPHEDLRRARAAGLSMIPTKTGAAQALGLVLPELAGKLDGLSVRVPTPNVSLVDAVFTVERPVSREAVNQAIQAAANRYLGYTEEPLVSIDLLGDPHSGVVDGGCTRVTGRTLKVMIWYDNEWGYANRVLDLILHMMERGTR